MSEFQPMINRIAYIGNYYPRKCGIATFTADLAESISNVNPGITSLIVAMNDREEGYQYPSAVHFELSDKDVYSYKVAAEYLNLAAVDIVSLQHEYGIFGGQSGSHILHLLRELRIPVVTTLHTILKDPDPSQLRILKEIGRLSSRLIAMSEMGAEFLQEVYKIPPEKIDFIHHGIPDIPFVDPNFYKDHFNVEGKTVLLTFGLLSRNKGIENVIKALPSIVHAHPDLIYLIVGATHPNVQVTEGEAYRESLELLASELGVSQNIQFDNRFVSRDELLEYIGAADLYITPYLNPRQIVSGTLAYTLGAGKAIISTPYWYAEEMLKDGRGVIVPFGNPDAIAAKVIDLLENDAERHAMRKRAYVYGREMIWPRVAEHYLDSFEKARLEPVIHPFTAVRIREMQDPDKLPVLNLGHLRAMSDDTGMLQHAILTLPNYQEGYTTDDNARALIAAVLAETTPDVDENALLDIESRYLAFLWYALDQRTNKFRNFLGYDRLWKEEIGSPDSNGRALWALGVMSARTRFTHLQESAAILFNKALPIADSLEFPRSWAFVLLGIDEHLKHFPGDRMAQSLRKKLSSRLMELFTRNSRPGWLWYEDTLTYSNARLAQAVIVSGAGQGDVAMTAAGIESLEWLCRQQTGENGLFSPVGNQGWFALGEEKAKFDQQPVEAAATISATLAAYRVKQDGMWLDEARRAFRWFLGENDLGLQLYDPLTGGCRDGLHPDRVNMNEGAESTLSFLISLMEIQSVEQHPEERNQPGNGHMLSMPVQDPLHGQYHD